MQNFIEAVAKVFGRTEKYVTDKYLVSLDHIGLDATMDRKIQNFNPKGVYSRGVEHYTIEDSSEYTWGVEESDYHPVIFEVEDLRKLKQAIDQGHYRGDGVTWLWYLLVPKGSSQEEGWFPLPKLWDSESQCSLSPNLIEVKESLEALMKEV